MNVLITLMIFFFGVASWAYTYEVSCSGTLDVGGYREDQPQLGRFVLTTNDLSLNNEIHSLGRGFLLMGNIFLRDQMGKPLKKYSIAVDTRRKVEDEQPWVILAINGIEQEGQGQVTSVQGPVEVTCQIAVVGKSTP